MFNSLPVSYALTHSCPFAFTVLGLCVSTERSENNSVRFRTLPVSRLLKKSSGLVILFSYQGSSLLFATAHLI